MLGTVPSDAHTWNLVYLQLLMEEAGMEVVNLGSCTPIALLCDAVENHGPDLIVISSVNGHGASEGSQIAAELHARNIVTPRVIGGKLGTDGGQDTSLATRLLELGYAAVYSDAESRATRSLSTFETDILELSRGASEQPA